jgi:hypothetical protein
VNKKHQRTTFVYLSKELNLHPYKFMIKIVFALICISQFLTAAPKERTLYNSLDPNSILQHFAFYELYPDTAEGKLALDRAYFLLAGDKISSKPHFFTINPETLKSLISLINKQPLEQTPELSKDEIEIIKVLGERLHNRTLRGYRALSESEVLALPTEEIDLARGLFLSQMSPANESEWNKMQTYEATLDLMALQILAKMGPSPTPEEKIAAINRFIFEEMSFRFPPHSAYAKDIDLYTFLPSVLDSRRGVCLGVSILYICIAQRLDLPLEMVTPPGHIYVRYKSPEGTEINIETTARGIHLDSDTYLGINTRSLQQRNIKEVIGLAHFNHASVYWSRNDYQKALDSYLIAQKYLPNDYLLKELMAYNYLLIGNVEKGEQLLKEIAPYLPDHVVSKETVAEDYLTGKVDAEGIRIAFMHVDETRKSLLEKRKALEELLEKFPHFRSGLSQLAVTMLQLYRAGEALEILKKYHLLDPNDPSVEYYISALYGERCDYNQSWKHLQQAELLVEKRQHKPKVLIKLRKELAMRCPE